MKFGAKAFVFPYHRFHGHQIDDAVKLVLSADRKLYGHWARSEPFLYHFAYAEIVGSQPVHLVDESQSGYAVFVGLPPDRLGLRLHAPDGTKNRHRAVEHPQRPFDLDGEIDVTRCIDNIDPMVTPQAGRRRRSNRDAALLFLDHPVHGRGSFVHLTEFVVDPGVIQDALGRGGFSRIDVCHDPNVAGFL